MDKVTKPPRTRPTELPITDDNRFWMIHVEGTKGPKTRHTSFLSAYAEAVKMSLHFKGRGVTVLESIGSVQSGEKLSDKEKLICQLERGKKAIEQRIAELSAP